MQEAELESDLVLAFAAQLRRHYEIERGPFCRHLLRGELAPRLQQAWMCCPDRGGNGRKAVHGGDAERSIPGDHLQPQYRFRHISRRPRSATEAQPVLAWRQLESAQAARVEAAW